MKIDNYARCISSGRYVFFADETRPMFAHPERFAFYRVPAGQDPETFRGQLVGVSPAEPEPDSDTPVSAPS